MLEQIGQEIAMSASNIIGYGVLITDNNGIVIGAADQARLNTKHGASLPVIKQRQAMHHDLAAAQRLEGTLPGMTLPIEIGDEVVGTIGISGNPEDISRYGMLIKTMAEMLLKERMELEAARLRDQHRQNLLREIVCFNPHVDDKAIVINHGQLLGYNMNLPRMAVLIEIDRTRAVDDDPVDEHFNYHDYRRIRKVFFAEETLCAALGSMRYIVFEYCLETQTEAQSVVAIKEKCQQLVEAFAGRQIGVKIGIGCLAKDIVAMAQSYHDAFHALAIGKRMHVHGEAFFINDMFLEKLMINIPRESYERFFRENMTDLYRLKDHEELFKVITYWCEAGFNATQAVKQLNIHKNTLKYRLSRIEKLTGFDLYNYKDTIALYLAVNLYYFYGAPPEKTMPKLPKSKKTK